VASCAAAIAIAGTAQGTADVQNLSGAGSTLVAPLISVWTKPFKGQSGIGLTYNGIGSGGGIQAISNRQVDFGASDAPLTPDQFSAAKGVKQFPWALSAVAITYNVPGVAGGLHLSPLVVSSIYLGHIKTWNNPQIKALNPGVKLPALKITCVFRSDSSGTTYAFTDLLAKVSSEWRSRVGRSTLVNFPTGVGAKGSSGVAGVVAGTKGTIGYVGVDYSVPNHLKVAALRNNAGRFLTPTVATIAAAAATVHSVPSNNAISLTNPSGKQTNAYADATFTYIIVPVKTSKALELKALIRWAVVQGQAYGPALHFARLPVVVKNAVLNRIGAIHT
jgi:phosphate transport system substrate-binding protein